MSITRLHRLRNEVGHHSLFVVLTNECNTFCRYCSCMPVLGKGWTELATSTLIELIEWFSERREGMQSIQFSGGEPLLHPDAFQLIKKSVDLGYITRLQTNGLIAESLSTSDFSILRDVRVKVSLDGPTAEVHEIYRKKGSFAGVIKGIQNLLNNGITVGAKTVFTRGNVSCGNDLILFLSELGVHGFTYNCIEQAGHAKTLRDASVSEYAVTKSIIGALAKK